MKGRILLVDDEPQILEFTRLLLSSENFEVVAASSIDLANDLVTASLINKQPFNLAVLDLHVGMDSGGEFGRRLMEIIGKINVLILTGHADPARMLSYRPDHTLIKPVNKGTLKEVCSRLMKPLRRNVNSPKVMLNQWLVTQPLKGIESLRFHSSKMDTSKPGEDTEKITSIASNDESYINTVIYNNRKVDKGVINIALSSLLGCPGGCAFCKNHKNRLSKRHEIVEFVRQLSTDEIIGQAYLAINSPRVKQALKGSLKTKLMFNFAVEGDGLVYNLDNCARAIMRLGKITKPEISFIITSIGSESSLMEFTRKYINLPNIKHYWSVDSLVPEKRALLKPGTIGDSLEKMRNCYEMIANLTHQRVSVSWVVIRGFNDSLEDAVMIADFFKNRPFDIKLMRLVPRSLDGVKGFETVEPTTSKDVERFRKYLLKLGMENVRKRDIVGLLINAGCGNTTVEWLNGSEMNQ